MKPAPFTYTRPETKEEALSALAEFGDDAVVLAGGLSLGAMLNMRLVYPEVVIDINRLPEFDRIEHEDGFLRTGALLRQEDALTSSEIAAAAPLLHHALPHVGHYQTRSRGTLAGSLAHADPSAEIPLCLATLGGAVELSSQRGIRRVAARDFAESALATCRAGDEMITALYWPAPADTGGVAFAEVAQRHGDFAILAAAASARRDGRGFAYSLGLGGVEGCPRVLDGVAPATSWEAAARDAVSDFVERLDPMADSRVSAAYRHDLALHLGIDTLLRALQSAAGA